MIHFDKLSMRNFFSYGNVESVFKLDNPGSTFVMGRNLDDTTDGESGNGTGKSSLIDALVYCLYGKPLRKDVTVNGLINNINDRDMYVKLWFSANGHKYYIERARKVNGSATANYVKVEEDGKEITLGDRTSEMDSYIAAKILRLPYELFVRIVVFSATSHSFFDLPATSTTGISQMGIVEELFGLNTLTKDAKILKEMIKADKQSISVKEEIIRQIEQEQIRLEQQIKNAKERIAKWTEDQKEKKTNLESQLEAIKGIDIEEQEEYLRLISEAEETIRDAENAKRQLESWGTEQRTKKEGIEIQLDSIKDIDVDEQRKYHEEISAAEKKLEEIDKEKARIGSQVREKQNKKDVIEKQLNSIKDIDVEEQKAYYEAKTAAQESLKEIARVKITLEKEIRESREGIDAKQNELEELGDSKCPRCHQPYAKAKEEIPVLKEQIAELRETLDENETYLTEVLEMKTAAQEEFDDSTAKLEVDDIESLVEIKSKSEQLTQTLGETNETLDGLEEKFKELDETGHSIGKEVVAFADLLTTDNIEELIEVKSKSEQMATNLKELDKELADNQTSLDELVVIEEDALKGVTQNKEMLTVADIDALIEIKTRKANIGTALKAMDGEENPHLGALAELEGIEVSLEEIDELEAMKERLDHQNFVLKLLTRKDSVIRKTLLGKNLPYLNSRLKHYIAEIGLPHHIEFKKDLTIGITRYGKEFSFGNLSNGQQSRVNIALSFAFRDTLQKLHQSVNFVMLDEILDEGLDGVGVSMTAKFLKGVARNENATMYVVSHREELRSMFDRVLTIALEGGFSTVEA